MTTADLLADRLFAADPAIRYVAVLLDGELRMRSRFADHTTMSVTSDHFEETLVNPALLGLAGARGTIDRGGLRHLAVGYRRCTALVVPLGGRGHATLSLESTTEVESYAELARSVATASGVDVVAGADAGLGGWSLAADAAPDALEETLPFVGEAATDQAELSKLAGLPGMRDASRLSSGRISWSDGVEADGRNPISHRYALLLVEPTLLGLAGRRAQLGYGALDFLLLAYGDGRRLLVPEPDGHLGLELTEEASAVDVLARLGQPAGT